MIPNKDIEQKLEQTMQGVLICPKCEMDFSFEEGAQGPIKLGVNAKIVMCPNCYSAYIADVTLRNVVLGDEVTGKYPAIVQKKLDVKLETCKTCHRLRKAGSFTCPRCGYVEWKYLVILGVLAIPALGVAIFGKEIVSFVGWLFGLFLSSIFVSELIKAFRTPKTYSKK